MRCLPDPRLTEGTYRFDLSDLSKGLVEIRAKAGEVQYPTTVDDVLEMVRQGLWPWQADGQGWVIPRVVET